MRVEPARLRHRHAALHLAQVHAARADGVAVLRDVRDAGPHSLRDGERDGGGRGQPAGLDRRGVLVEILVVQRRLAVVAADR
jgi:hypothetical protein